MKHLPWYWEIKRSGSGPNYYLSLAFAMTDAELGQWIEQLMSADYNLIDSRTWAHKDNRSASYLNVTVYPEATITIELGWGVEQSEADELIQQLVFSSCSSQLVRWHVYTGGEGYSGKDFGQGTDVASLLEYCRQA